MQVKVHLLHQSKPVVIDDVRNTYEKGSYFCVMTNDGDVQKFPTQHVFRIVEPWGDGDSESVVMPVSIEDLIPDTWAHVVDKDGQVTPGGFHPTEYEHVSYNDMVPNSEPTYNFSGIDVFFLPGPDLGEPR